MAEDLPIILGPMQIDSDNILVLLLALVVTDVSLGLIVGDPLTHPFNCHPEAMQGWIEVSSQSTVI
jgi:hypothetical protein